VIWRVGLVGLLLLVGAGLLFIQEQGHDETSLEFARTVAVNAFVMGQIFYLLSARSFHRPAYTRDGLLGSRAVLLAIGVCLALQLLFTYAPFMNLLFGTAPLDAEAWLRCAAVGVAVFVLVELEKLVLRRRLGASEPRTEASRADREASRAATSGPDAALERRREEAP
jgi:magnesium-transporting ATPase (P-type)